MEAIGSADIVHWPHRGGDFLNAHANRYANLGDADDHPMVGAAPSCTPAETTRDSARLRLDLRSILVIELLAAAANKTS